MKARGPGRRVTLADVREWGATCGVPDAAAALGVGKSCLYEAIAAGDAPVATVRVGSRVRVPTASLIRVLEGRDTGHGAGS